MSWHRKLTPVLKFGQEDLSSCSILLL